MNKVARLFKPLMPILSAVYGLGVIYITALPADGNHPTIVGESLTWLLTLVGIALTLFLVHRIEPKVFPAAGQFTLKLPKSSVIAGLLLLTPLWLVAEEYIVFGLLSLATTLQMEPIAYTPEELHEDLLASVHAVLLAPVLEELCYRQLAISPFRRRWVQIVVCVLMALLFGVVHVRNFLGAFLSAMIYGLVFIWTRNIWYAVVLHAGHNLTTTLLAVYCMFDFGEILMSKTLVFLLPDTKVIVAAIALASIGLFMLKKTMMNPQISEK